jgi:FKBP-type peptidyl-prolyl cis-trans isomerase SlpA
MPSWGAGKRLLEGNKFTAETQRTQSVLLFSLTNIFALKSVFMDGHCLSVNNVGGIQGEVLSKGVKYPIGAGSTVTLHLSLALEDGRVAESTFEGEPHTFTVGDGSLLPGLELALYGLRPGDSQHLVLHPAQAFGTRDAARIHTMSRTSFTDDISLEPGLIIGFTDTGGMELPGTLLSVTDTAVEVDFNHPLAGHAITFDVEIIDVIPGSGDDAD